MLCSETTLIKFKKINEKLALLIVCMCPVRPCRRTITTCEACYCCCLWFGFTTTSTTTTRFLLFKKYYYCIGFGMVIGIHLQTSSTYQASNKKNLYVTVRLTILYTPNHFASHAFYVFFIIILTHSFKFTRVLFFFFNFVIRIRVMWVGRPEWIEVSIKYIDC